MRVLVCGGRDFDDYDFLIEKLDALHKKHNIELIIEGGCRGADTHAAIWAESNGITRMTFFANWEKFGKRAGRIRNREMIKWGLPDCVVAFDGGRGTQDMVNATNEANIKLWDLRQKNLQSYKI